MYYEKRGGAEADEQGEGFRVKVEAQQICMGVYVGMVVV